VTLLPGRAHRRASSAAAAGAPSPAWARRASACGCARASRWLTPSFSLSIRTRLRATTSPVSLLRALYTCLGHRAGGKHPLRTCIPRKLARASSARYTTPALTRKSPRQLDSRQRTRRCRQTSSPSAAFVPPTFRPSHRSTVQPQAPRPEALAGGAHHRPPARSRERDALEEAARENSL
jgi:hypothetical protein